MPINVVHIVRQYSPSVGGMEDVVQNIARQQREHHDQRPKIVTLNRLFKNSTELLAREAEVNGVDVVRLPFHGTSRYPFCPQVLRQVTDADVIHVHGIDFFFDYMALTKPFHHRPLVASTHGGFFHTTFASTLKKIYFNSVTRASSLNYDQIIATSENDGQIFKKIVKPSTLTVIENGVNVEKYSNLSSATPTQTMIYFGRWSANKGLLETLALFKELSDGQAGWKLIIAGREYDHTAAELQHWVTQHNLTDLVQIVPNPSESELADLIGQASYFICLSRHEGFGIAPIEAMSAGLTPLLSDIPPFRHLVMQSEMGIILSAENIHDSVEALLKLHSTGHPDHARRRMQAQYFAERYNWRHIANRYADIYTQLAARTSPKIHIGMSK
ncbi:glycosyltransferase family 4 protein [Glaciimonas sp. Cout2]|uniref:glycosyltransferase family 4 protein n=2 Tax=Glaciimonas TaxID=1229970 RepID=UPI002AB49DD1|nr:MULTISPECIES: glycosyltransferase family 4 protein [unclassified Glaciimonas]MDY7547136.1 glycosyltransferase family 4 protein [Glaciimonas sp. CA11.2]MEB0011021.1 glycosyltransferase family 4 protein [Glaciimonas sp. Cout2]